MELRDAGDGLACRELTFSSADGTYRVEVRWDALEAMLRLSAGSGAVETGGVLLGRYAADGTTAVVHEATPPPPDSVRTPNTFVRGTAGLPALLRERWDRPERTFYLGEWHFHTAPPGYPSGQDLRQMRQVAVDEAYRCASPLLVIVAPARPSGWVFRVYVFPAGDTHRELPLVPAAKYVHRTE